VLESVAAYLSTVNARVFAFRCFPHIFNLAVQDGIDVIKPYLERLKAQVTHLRKSTTALSLLETLCRNNEETYHSPQNDTPTRDALCQ